MNTMNVFNTINNVLLIWRARHEQKNSAYHKVGIQKKSWRSLDPISSRRSLVLLLSIRKIESLVRNHA